MSFDSFFRQYLETALWSSTDESDERGGEHFDKNYSVSDIAPSSLKHLRKEAKRFYDEYGDKWTDDGQAGHDFWLTRNRHGAGFWDREEMYGGKANAGFLTEASQKFGEEDLHLDDKGRIRAAYETVTRRSR